MRKTLLLLTGIVLLSLMGCTSTLYVHTTRPPKAGVNPGQWKVSVINRFNPDLLEYRREKKIETYARAASAAYAGAIEAIQHDNTFRLIHTDSMRYRMRKAGEILNNEQISDLHRRHPHHLLLSLDLVELEMEQETVKKDGKYGSLVKTAHFYLLTKTTWTLYDSTGRVLDKVRLSRRQFYQSRDVMSGLLAAGPDMANTGPLASRLATITGHDYRERLHPQPITYSRSFYNRSSLTDAGAYMAAGRWSLAIAELKPLAAGKKSKTAGRAAYNLAVVYEALDEMEEAKYWAEEALHKNNKLATQLLNEWASR